MTNNPSIIENVNSRMDGGDLHNAMAVASWAMPDLAQSLRSWLDLVYIFSGWFSVSLEVFLRTNFGERHLNWMRLYLAYSLMTVALMIAMAFGALDVWIIGFVGFYVGLSVFHVIHIQWKNRKGILWHSRMIGLSAIDVIIRKLIGWKLPVWVLTCIAEPAAGFFAASFFGQLSPMLGLWLGLASFSLALRNMIVQSNLHAKELDYKDAQIEMLNLPKASAGYDVRDTAGVVAVRVPALEKARANGAHPGATGGDWANA